MKEITAYDSLLCEHESQLQGLRHDAFLLDFRSFMIFHLEELMQENAFSLLNFS